MTYNSITFIEYSSIKDAVQSTEKHILITLRREEFVASDIELAKLATIEKLEIDIRYWDYSEPSLLFSLLVQLPNLVGLRLEGCKIKSDPASIGQLKNLLFLSLKRNEISELPKELKRLKKLEGLSLAHNSLVMFPEVVTELSTLRELDIEHNKLETLPDSICGLAHLSHFDFEYNQIEFPPTCLLKMKELKAVYYSMNKDTRTKHFKPFVKKYEKIHYRSVYSLDNLLDESDVVPLVKVLSFFIKTGNSDELVIPSTIQKYTNVRQIAIRNTTKLQSLPKELIKLKRLETLSVGGCHEMSLLSFPLTKIKNLHAIHLQNFVNQQELEHLFTSKTLRSIYINNQTQDYIIKDYDIKNMKIFSITGRKILFEIHTNKMLRELKHISIRAKEYNISGLFKFLKRLPMLTYLSLGNFKDDLRDFSFLDDFPHLEALVLEFTGTNKYDYPSLFAKLAQIKILKRIQITLNEAYIPVEVDLINSLGKNFKLRYNSSVISEKDWTNMEMAILKEPILINPAHNSLKKANSFITKYKDIQISDKGRKILFALYMDKVEELKELLTEFGTIPYSENAILFVDGKITGMTKLEITESCKNTNINLSKKFNSSVSHVVVTKTTKYATLEKYLNSNVSILNQEEFKKILWENDKPFLMEKGATSMNEQIFDLFFSKQTENIVVAIQLLKTGGVNNSTLSLIAALTFFHVDKNVRKDARSVFNKFASDNLRNYCKLNWKNKYREGVYYGNDFINHVASLSEIHSFEFKLFVNYIRPIKLNTPIFGLRQLTVRNFTKFSELIFKCPELHYLNVSSQVIDFEPFFDTLSQFKNLDILYIHSNNLKNFEKGLSKLENLKMLHLTCPEVIENAGKIKIKSSAEEFYLNIKLKNTEFDFSDCPKLKKLTIRNSPITQFTNFRNLPNFQVVYTK
jgi:Leucine-rich repeat (LRR) protein